jgi:hypothetical protein
MLSLEALCRPCLRDGAAYSPVIFTPSSSPAQFLGQLSPDRSATDEKWREVASTLAHIDCLLADQKAALPPDAQEAIRGTEASMKKRSLAAVFGAWTRKNHSMDVVIPAELAWRFKRGTRELFEPQADGSFLVPGLAYQTVTKSDIPGVIVSREGENGVGGGGVEVG